MPVHPRETNRLSPRGNHLPVSACHPCLRCPMCNIMVNVNHVPSAKKAARQRQPKSKPAPTLCANLISTSVSFCFFFGFFNFFFCSVFINISMVFLHFFLLFFWGFLLWPERQQKLYANAGQRVKWKKSRNELLMWTERRSLRNNCKSGCQRNNAT